MSAPFFSVITTTFNRARLIERAINSMLGQSFQDWEMIIIDDGSKDNTFQLIQPIILGDKRISYHFSSNKGVAKSRNIGIALAKGSYITFLDSDDEYLPEHLQSRFTILNNDPTIELLHGGVAVIGDAFVADKHDPSKRIPLSECVIGGTFFIKKSLPERIGVFEEIPYSDDSNFFERAVKAKAVISKTDLPTYRYYRTEIDSLCSIAERAGIEGILAYQRGEQL